VFLSADFRYYGQISDGLFSILRRYSPMVEEYSIDEGFIDMTGLRTLYRKPWQQIADDIRNTIHNELGVTVSIGISVTRMLAKMASEYNKPNGTTIVAGRRIMDFLQQVRVRDIPGIGANREALLKKFNIRSGAEFAAAPEHHIKRLLGKAGTDLWHELNGTSLYGVESEPPLPKSVARTASMGQLTREREVIRSHLMRHAMRLSRELIEKRLTAKQLSFFLALKSFDKCAQTRQLAYPNADYFVLVEEAGNMLDALFVPAHTYRACGLVATGITARETAVYDLFQQCELKVEERHVQLLETVYAINDKHGANSVGICGMAGRGGEQQQRFCYPVMECG
jgi:DNA polymerase-4/DNA polymerase V